MAIYILEHFYLHNRGQQLQIVYIDVDINWVILRPKITIVFF